MSTLTSAELTPESAERSKRSAWYFLAQEKGFAKRQFARLLIPSIVSVCVFVVALGYFYEHLLDVLAGADLTLYLTPDELERLDDGLPGLSQFLIVAAIGFALLALVTTMFSGVYIVLKLARPLNLFKQAFSSFGEGQLDVDVDLDKRDEFQDLAETLNLATARIQIMVMSIKDSTDIIEAHRKTIREHNELDHAIRGLREAVEYFETVDLQLPPVGDANDQ